ncbi:hypothetical protein FJZ26_02715 [Candidatus Parvarchaeota archaeon]|nr:hypothetical protein [Candidatus Parvarchaeota archaeon]
MEIVESLKYALNAVTDGKLHMDFAKYMAYTIAFVIVVAVIVLGMIFGGSLLSATSEGGGASVFLLLILFFGALVVVNMYVSSYFSGKFIRTALANEGFAKGDFTFGLAWKFLVATIAQGLHVMLFWREKKHLVLWVLPLIGVAVMFFVAYLPGLALAILLGIPLFIGWIYHGVRLSVMSEIFLCDITQDIGACSQKAWAMTNGKAATIFIYQLVFGIAIMVVMLPLILVGLVIPCFNYVVQILLTPLLTGISAYFGVYIYREIKREAEGGVAPQRFVAPQAPFEKKSAGAAAESQVSPPVLHAATRRQSGGFSMPRKTSSGHMEMGDEDSPKATKTAAGKAAKKK